MLCVINFEVFHSSVATNIVLFLSYTLNLLIKYNSLFVTNCTHITC